MVWAGRTSRRAVARRPSRHHPSPCKGAALFDPAALAALGRRAITQVDLSALLDEASALIARTFDAERCAVLELAADGTTLRWRAGCGWPDGVAEPALAAQAGYTLTSAEPVRVHDLRSETRFDGAALLGALGAVSGLSATIPGRDRPFGVLAVHTAPSRLFGDDEADGLAAMAAMLGLSIERLRTTQELRKAEQRERALSQQAPWGVITYDPTGRLIDANRAALGNVTPEESAGYNVLEDEHMRAAGVLDDIRRAFAGEPVQLAPLYYDPSRVAGAPPGPARWTRGSLAPILDDAGAVCEVVAMVEDITAHQLAEEHLRDTEEQYRAIFEASSDALCIIALDGRIISANPAACRLYGYSVDELRCLSPTQLIHPDQYDHLAKALCTIATGDLFQTQSLHVRSDGTTFPVDVRITRFTCCGLSQALVIVRDITERVQAYHLLEERVAERTRELAGLLEVARTVASTLELEPLLGLILDHLKGVVDYSGATIRRLEGDDLTVLDYRGPLPGERVVGLHLPLAHDGPEHEVIRGGTSVILDDVRGETTLARAYRQLVPGAQPPEHVRSWLGVPLLLKDRVVGMLTMVHREPGHYTPHHATLALAMAQQAAVAIENARLYQQAQALAAQEERQRLARDLHDAVTQTLFSASLIAEVLPRLWERDPRAGQQRLEDVRLLTQGALAEMRTLLLELRPAALTEANLGDLLRQLVAALSGRKRLPVTLTLEEECTLPPDVQVGLYRVAQEALNNAARHSRATAIEVCLRCQGRGVVLQINDNGRGFRPAGIGAGHFGLRIMRERAAAIGATLTILSHPGAGTRVRVSWRAPRKGDRR